MKKTFSMDINTDALDVDYIEKAAEAVLANTNFKKISQITGVSVETLKEEYEHIFEWLSEKAQEEPLEQHVYFVNHLFGIYTPQIDFDAEELTGADFSLMVQMCSADAIPCVNNGDDEPDWTPDNPKYPYEFIRVDVTDDNWVEYPIE